MVTINKPKIALARLTSDSIASESKPTESVMYQASVLSVMVMMATTTEASSRRCGVKKRSGIKAMTCLAERDPGKLALANLHHVGARTQLQAFVADHAGVDANAAAVDQAVALTTGRSQAGKLQQGADAHGSATVAQRQGHFGNLVGHATSRAIVEILLGSLGRGG